MGLSSKQVSGDGLDWSQTLLQAQNLELPKPPMKRQQQNQNQQQQQSEPLKCPRCDSTNTKFCYYNNYNKSQPRHFCKTCKRHWTKGGTLRNVPVGGGRKNKRLKTSNPTTNTTTATTTATATATIPSTMTTSTNTTNRNINSRLLGTNMAFQNQQQRPSPSFVLGDYQKKLSGVLYQTAALIRPPSSLLLQESSICSSSSNLLDGKSLGSGDSVFIGPSLSLPQNQSLLHFPFTSSSSSSFDTNPSSISTSFQSSNVSNVYEYTGQTIEDPILTNTLMPTASNTLTQAWQMPSTSNGMDMTSYWNWDDFETLVSTDLNIPWEDPDVK